VITVPSAASIDFTSIGFINTPSFAIAAADTNGAKLLAVSLMEPPGTTWPPRPM
jgi:hypothetical protein